MILVYCFCPKDQDLALRNARWWNELGGCKGHELLVCYDPRCDPGVVEAIRQEMEKCFDKLWRMTDVAQVDGWPEGANYFFRLCCTWLQEKPQWPCFFWMEPDAIPLSPGWVDAIAAEYKRGGKPFMGDRVEVKINGEEVPLHMSGVGVYENPIFRNAGEAYRAHDVAWDMAAKDQIVPKAYFTELIEHAWKHPTFHELSELGTQIAPQTLLFHSSKDGSLIDLLAQKRRGKLKPEGQTQASHSGLPTQMERETSVPPSPHTLGGGALNEIEPRPVAPSPIYDIFIRTYPGDYEWLKYCLNSINKFVNGFRKTWIISTAAAPDWLKDVDPRVEWKVMNDETEDGYLAQQITKLYADVFTSYQADYILHVDSDIVFTRATTPEDFFVDGKMNWYYTPYEVIQTPWQPIIEKFMGFGQPFEFMRRLPMMVPRWLYPRLREFCHQQHGQVISDYIRTQPMREFSEFNALGAYAYFNARNRFHWRHTQEEGPMPAPLARQFHSWSGLTPEIKTEIETILGGDAACSERRKIPSAVSTAAPTVPPAGAAIKKLSSGVWVLEGDQISGWVEEEGRLDHDQNFLPYILSHIQRGDTVVDVGAFIGDHTLAYSKQVGDTGKVHAFEPNPIAYQCLFHNMKICGNVILHDVGLGDSFGTIPLSGNNGNWGGCYAGDHMKIADVPVQPMDAFTIAPDFIKIDVEGYELKMLEGAARTIDMYKPTMVIEINSGALERQGATPDQIFGWLTQHLYGWHIIEENRLRNDPLYNIIALPAVDKPGSAQVKAETLAPERIDASASALTPSPQVPTKGMVYDCIEYLRKFSAASPGNKSIVSARLVHVGLRKANKKYGANKTHKPTKWKRRAAAKEREA